MPDSAEFEGRYDHHGKGRPSIFITVPFSNSRVRGEVNLTTVDGANPPGTATLRATGPTFEGDPIFKLT